VYIEKGAMMTGKEKMSNGVIIVSLVVLGVSLAILIGPIGGVFIGAIGVVVGYRMRRWVLPERPKGRLQEEILAIRLEVAPL
jgi:hypothetical protein